MSNNDKSNLAISCGGEYSVFSTPQEFSIVSLNHNKKDEYLRKITANAAFLFHGYIVSFSTPHEGGCLKEVSVLDSNRDFVIFCNTVEEAITRIIQKDFDTVQVS